MGINHQVKFQPEFPLPAITYHIDEPKVVRPQAQRFLPVLVMVCRPSLPKGNHNTYI